MFIFFCKTKIIFIIKLSARVLLLDHMKAHCLHLGYRNIPQFLQSNESKREAVSLGPPLWTRLTHNLGSLPTLKHRFKILDTNLTRTKILSKTISSDVFCMLLLHVDWTIVMHSILELLIISCLFKISPKMQQEITDWKKKERDCITDTGFLCTTESSIQCYCLHLKP